MDQPAADIIKSIGRLLPRKMEADWRQGVMGAVKAGDAAQLNDLLEVASKHLGVSVNFTDRTGRTPLMVAASSGNPTICRLLLHHGAEVHARNTTTITDAYKFTALHYAARDGMHEAAAVLLQHGAKIYNIPKPWIDYIGNCSPLATAIRAHSDMAEYFLDYLHTHGTKVPLTSVLHTAINHQNEHCAVLVLHRGIFPFKDEFNLFIPFRMPDKRYTSYFHMAASVGLSKLMSSLVEINPYLLQEEWLVQNQLPAETKQHRDFVIWLKKHRRQPTSLVKLCKSTILAHLGDYYIPRINALPLPKLLQTVLASIKPSYDHK